VKNFSCVPTECAKQCTITVHHNKPKLVIICQESIQGLKEKQKKA